MKLIQNTFFASLATLICGLFILVQPANAVSPAAFKAERIIDDSVFYNSNALGSAQAVQDFISSHTPACDTWGTQPSGYGSLNRTQYAQQIKGWPGPPYVCLQNYHENPNTGQTSFEMGGGWFSGGQGAGQIIWDAAQQYGINPQVLLVFLKKESAGPLFADSWPLKSQYRYAMGYACPDSGPGYSAACVESKSGFYNQVNLAAWQLRYYANNISTYNYQPNRWNYIQYNPNPGCGGKNVFIENVATASLYIYTPYTPTEAALIAYPGEASCGAYGNRNFFMYFNEWFGSTNADVTITSPIRISSGYAAGLYTKVQTTASFDIRNNRNYPINVGGMSVAVRNGQGVNFDYPLQQMTIPANSMATYTASQVFPSEGSYTFSLANFSSGTWKADYPESSSIANPRQTTQAVIEMPTQTSNITFNNELRAGRDTTVSITIKNNSATSSLNAGLFAVAVRGPRGENFDLAPDFPVISAGQTYTYSKTFRPQYEGFYRFSTASTLNNGQKWESNYPLPLNDSIQSTETVTVKPGVTMTQPLQVSLSNPHVGQTITLSYKVKNYTSESVDIGRIGMYGRDPQGRNVDPGAASVILVPDEEKTISYTQVLNTEGVHKYGVLSTPDNGRTWLSGPVAETTGMQKEVLVNAGPPVTITQGPTLSVAPHIDQALTISIKVKNYSESTVSLGRIGMYGRDPQGRNVDPGAIETTLSAGEERTISYSITPQATGGFQFGVLQTYGNGVWLTGPAAESSSVKKITTVVVKPAVTMTEALASTNYVPARGDTVKLTYKLRNFSNSPVDIGRIGLAGRSPSWQNVDPGSELMTLAAGEEKVITYEAPVPVLGIYMFSTVGTQDNGRTWNYGPPPESSDLVQIIYVGAH